MCTCVLYVYMLCITCTCVLDVDIPTPDKKSVMMYVMCYFQVLPHGDIQVEEEMEESGGATEETGGATEETGGAMEETGGATGVSMEEDVSDVGSDDYSNNNWCCWPTTG